MEVEEFTVTLAAGSAPKYTWASALKLVPVMVDRGAAGGAAAAGVDAADGRGRGEGVGELRAAAGGRGAGVGLHGDVHDAGVLGWGRRCDGCRGIDRKRWSPGCR